MMSTMIQEAQDTELALKKAIRDEKEAKEKIEAKLRQEIVELQLANANQKQLFKEIIEKKEKEMT